jgi:FkbM family methyltransferase
MLKIFLVLPIAIAILPCLHAIDMWSTDYYVGFSNLGSDSALAVATVCNSDFLVAWGHGSHQQPPHESVASILSRARTLVHASKDHVSASLLLCHSKHTWLPASKAPRDLTLQLSNLLGIALWECTHFAGARAAFKLAESVMSAMSSAGVDCWALEADSVHFSEALMPAPTAVLLNAAHVAADAWDFAAALDFIERSKILQAPPLPHEPSSPAAKARASALEFSKHISGLHNKPGHTILMSSIVTRVLNISSFLRTLPHSPASLAALKSSSLWEGDSPQTHLKRHNWPPRLVECILQDIMVAVNLSNSNSVIDAAVTVIDSLVSFLPEGESSSELCIFARQTRIVGLLLQVVASAHARNFHHATAISALGHLVKCDGSLSFITSYGIEVMSALIRHGSRAERISAAKIMRSVVSNVASMIGRGLIQSHAIHRIVFRFALNAAPLDIFHRQQANTSVKTEDGLIKTLTKQSSFFSLYWNQLASITTLQQSLYGSTGTQAALDLLQQRLKHESTYARLAWFHSKAQAALVSFFGSEDAASRFVLDAIPENDRLKYDGAPVMEQDPGAYDPSGTLAHFGATSNHRDVFYVPQCAGLATNLLQCWFYKAGRSLPQSDCGDESLIACHHFHGQKDSDMFPNTGISVPDFSTSVAARDGILHHHLLDLYFTASLAVYGEWSALESEIIARHIPVGGVFLDIGAHVGTISAAIARHVGDQGKVIAVEVQPNFSEMIARTASANSLPQLLVVNAAIHESHSLCVTAPVSSGIAMATNFGGFEIAECKQYHKRLMLTKENRNSPHPTFSSVFGSEEAVVNTVAIDSLVEALQLTSLHAIKLDCEGSEFRALQGGMKALKKFSPAIFFEDNDVTWNEKNEASQYVPTSVKMQSLYAELLRPLGYGCTQLQVPVFNERNFRGQSQSIFGRQASIVIECKVQQESGEL